MLTTCLQQHPDVIMHGEVFGVGSAPMSFYGVNYYEVGAPLEDILVSHRDRDPVRFLYEFVLNAGARRAAGCKLKYEELLRPGYADLFAAIRGDLSIKVIHLRRENLLARYLSEHIAVKVTKVFNTQLDDAPDQVAVTLDVDDCRANFERTTERYEQFREVFRDHEVVELSYEELVDDLPRCFKAVTSLLGVPYIDVEPRTKKLRSRPPRDAIANFDELAAAFAGTEFATFFE